MHLCPKHAAFVARNAGEMLVELASSRDPNHGWLLALSLSLAMRSFVIMAYVITDGCLKDFVCVEQCATAAIAPTVNDPRSGAVPQVYINPDECIDCGNCAAVCQQNAIFAESDLPGEKAAFAEKNRAYFA